jgi:Zn-dependent metalloprotease
MFDLKIILPAMLLLGSSTTPAESAELPKAAQPILLKLHKESGNTLTVKWDQQTRTPALLAGQLTPASRHSPGWIAYSFLENVKPLYGLKNVHKDMKITAIDSSGGSTKVYMQRQLFSKPVCGDELLVELDRSGAIQRVAGSIHTGLEQQRLGRPMYPAVSREQARRIATAYDEALAGRTLSIEPCYLPAREGVPLVYTITYEKDRRPVTLKIHSLTGRVIE